MLESILRRLEVQGVCDIKLDNHLVLNKVSNVGTMLVVPIGVTGVHSGCFKGQDRLCDVRLCHTLESIDFGAFSECNNLEVIYLPKSLRKFVENVSFGNNARVMLVEG